MTVAQTILEQLGGRQFVMMTGARNLLAAPNYLQFKLPGSGGFCKQGINRVVVMLQPSDTYTVEFYRDRGGKTKMVAQYHDVYVENLREIFREATGLETRMPNVKILRSVA